MLWSAWIASNQPAGILLREESLWYDEEQDDGHSHRGGQHQHDDAAVPQRPAETVFIAANEGGKRIPPASRPARRPHPQNQRAQHRRRRQRDHQRNQNRHGQGHGEFAKQPAEQSSHQQDRRKNRDERNADRGNRESDFLRAEQGRLEAWHARLEVAGDVLQDNDRIIDDKTRGDRQRHQGERVEAVVQEIHRSERADDRYGHGDRRDNRGACIAEKQENDEGHQHHRDHQRPLRIVQRGANGHAAIGGQHDVDVARHRSAQIG